MESAPHSGQNQSYLGVGNFVVYADFNCPFCYALNERLHAMDLADRVEYRSVQRAPLASSATPDLGTLVQLTGEVAELRRRAPSIQVAVPPFRPSTAAASKLLDAVSKQFPDRASELRRGIFRALWVDGLDISQQPVLDGLLADLDIALPPMDLAPSNEMTRWQEDWDNDSEFKRNLPIVISELGDKVIGFPFEPELNVFLQTGTLVSDKATTLMHGDPKSLPRILVLDDDVPALQLIIEQMNSSQVEIMADFDSLLTTALDHGIPDLVLVNTALIGDVEGSDCDWWRNSADMQLDAALPVIFLSDDKSTEAEVAAFEAGAADFIAKPFHPRVLRARLNMHLQARESQRQLNNIARVDGLTAISNRREFDLRLMSEWSRGARTGQSLALLMIDVDKFKEYNDLYGHIRGDQCLIEVARVLKICTQRTSDLIARYGGEEFVALLPDSDLEGGLTVAEDCLQAIADAAIEHLGSDVAPYITVSIGVAAMLPIHDKSSTMLIEQADIALYQAKQNGRNQLCSFSAWS
jgi:diguanylate cyclase (GGDEF)-like protein